jgi:arylsulfatase A-like enzyme
MNTVLLSSLCSLYLCGEIAGAPPNVLVILSDDQGWGDLSLHGNADVRTPNLDALATAGARFERFFVQPVCSPTRAEFLTGRYHPRTGVRGVTTGGERLNLDETTLADCFKAAGYATGCFGKWHNGSQYPYHPLGRGFGEFYGFTSGHWGDYFSPPLDHDGRAVQGKEYITDDLTDRAVGFIDRHRDKPFFCYVPYNVPHSPMQVPDADWDRFKDKKLTLGPTAGKPDLPHTRAALAMVENMDRNVGRLLAALAERKLTDNTIVVFFHDNGPNGNRFTGGLKGRKGSTDEGGVKSPLFVRWPGTVPAGLKVEPVAGAIDLLPTLLDLCGVKRVGERPLDGISFAPGLRGGAFSPPPRKLVQHWAGRVSVRAQSHRLDHTGRLYDTDADPGQTTDLTAMLPAVVADLKATADAWRRDVLAATQGRDDRPFPVGRGDFPTVLPARDGVPHGGVKRSAQAPNCSYFTAWAKPTDAMTWDVEAAAGRYEAIVHYTCPAADVGSAVELTTGAAKWAGTVTPAHDPPARGAENDRTPRVGESLVKDFRPLSLGVADMPAGRFTLSLRATTVAGRQVAEVRAVELVRR